MELFIRNVAGSLTPKENAYAHRKLGQLQKTWDQAEKVEFVHSIQKQHHQVAVTVYAGGLVLRSEESNPSITAAIDLVADKIRNRLRKVKDRMNEPDR